MDQPAANTTRPRPVGKRAVVTHGNSTAVTVTTAAEEAGLNAGDQLHAFISPDGRGVMLSRFAFDPLANGWESYDDDPRTVRDKTEYSQYVTLPTDLLDAVGLSLGDDVELSASDGRILIRPW